MNVSDELHKLSELHRNGDLSDLEFRDAKRKVLNGESQGAEAHMHSVPPEANVGKKGIPGLGLAAGVFFGNLIAVPIISGGDVARGFGVGAIAAVLVLIFYAIAAAMRKA